MISEIIFDVETQKLFSEIDTENPGDLGISIVSLYKREVDADQTEISGKIYSFWENELDNMWSLFTGVKRVIGFNSVKFDVPALAPYAKIDLAKLNHLDIMQIVRQVLGRSLSLNLLVNTTLGKTKSDSGVTAVEYFKSQNPEKLNKLKQYCEDDVNLTKELYDYGVKNKKIFYIDKWNNRKEIPVDFAYPQEIIESSRQIGLF